MPGVKPDEVEDLGKNVTAQEYVSLVTSHRRVVRVNRVPAPVHRLLDVETGERFWIKERDLNL